jgi:tetratricopeptide (TPR) repeat protein
MEASETFDEAAVLIERAEAYFSQTDFAAGRKCYHAALATLRRDRPDDPATVRALVGLAWTVQALSDGDTALCLHEEALATQMRVSANALPAICTIRRGIAAALALLGRIEEAQEQYRQVLTMQRDLLDCGDPDLAETLNILGEIAARQGQYREARRYQEEALASLRQMHPPKAPEVAAALTNLGVSLYRLDEPQKAEACLREALAIDPDLLLAAENLIHVLYQQGRKTEGRVLAAQKYRRQSFVVQPAPARPTGTLLVLWSLDGNVPKQHLLSRLPLTVVDWHIQYANDQHEQRLPPFHLVFNLIGDPDQGAAALECAVAFQQRCATKLLNDPVKLRRTRRDLIPDLLAGVDGLEVPRVLRLACGDLRDPGRGALLAGAGIRLPLLLRTAGTHGGETVQRVDTEAALAAACAKLHRDETVYATAYHEYASPDGFYRKYRAIFVDRTVFPYHLAISPNWLVHYFSAEMPVHSWKLAEELAYLHDATAVLGERACAVLAAVARRMDLDYCGADFTVLPDGRVLLFEANATMLVHPEDEDSVLAAKNPYVSRIFAAFDGLVERSLPTWHHWQTGEAAHRL